MRRIRAWISRTHDGWYVFSKWPPEVKLVGTKRVLHQRERDGQVDPWWYGLTKPMCPFSMQTQDVELEPLEGIEVEWHMEIKGEKRALD